MQTNASVPPGLGCQRCTGVRAHLPAWPVPSARPMAGDQDGPIVAHVMANSGWAWHLFARTGNSSGAGTGVGLWSSTTGADWRRSSWPASRRACDAIRAHAAALVVPTRFLQEVLRRQGMPAHVIPQHRRLGLSSDRADIGQTASSAVPVHTVRRIRAILERSLRQRPWR